MLVLQPNKRVTIEQIKRHRWMMVEIPVDIPMVHTAINNSSVGGTAAYEPNDQILRIMQNLGIDAQRTRESLKVNIKDRQWNFIYLHYFYKTDKQLRSLHCLLLAALGATEK
jgi:hypothetical protein